MALHLGTSWIPSRRENVRRIGRRAEQEEQMGGQRMGRWKSGGQRMRRWVSAGVSRSVLRCLYLSLYTRYLDHCYCPELTEYWYYLVILGSRGARVAFVHSLRTTPLTRRSWERSERRSLGFTILTGNCLLLLLFGLYTGTFPPLPTCALASASVRVCVCCARSGVFSVVSLWSACPAAF